MKKVISFIASPRKNGNTDTIVQKLIEGLNSSELVTEIVYLSDYRIYSCNGCLSCSGTGKCVIEDDMNLLYPKIEEADGYIFASPTYNQGFLDRLFCYYQFNKTGKWTSLLGDVRKAYVAGVCAGLCIDAGKPQEDSMGYTIQAMKRPLEDLGIKVVKEIRYYNSRKLPVRNNIDFQDKLVQMGIEFRGEFMK